MKAQGTSKCPIQRRLLKTPIQMGLCTHIHTYILVFLPTDIGAISYAPKGLMNPLYSGVSYTLKHISDLKRKVMFAIPLPKGLGLEVGVDAFFVSFLGIK